MGSCMMGFWVMGFQVMRVPTERLAGAMSCSGHIADRGVRQAAAARGWPGHTMPGATAPAQPLHTGSTVEHVWGKQKRTESELSARAMAPRRSACFPPSPASLQIFSFPCTAAHRDRTWGAARAVAKHG